MSDELSQFIAKINLDPDPGNIKKNEDGSMYIPISIIQSLLDDFFFGHWDFEMTNSSYGRIWARGNGYMDVLNPISKMKVRRSGDAGILLTGDLKMDSPRLEAMVLLSCAKKFGAIFGRNLNRNKEDSPLLIIQERRNEVDDVADAEWGNVKGKLSQFSSKTAAQEYLDTTNFKYTIEAKNIIKSIPNE